MRHRRPLIAFLTLLAAAPMSAFAAKANAGPDQTVPELTIVTLNGTRSTAAKGATLTYEWTQLDGPGVQLSNPNSPSPTFTAPSVDANQTLRFRLTVTDVNQPKKGPGSVEAAKTDSDEVRITVQDLNPGGAAPTANAGPDQEVNSGARVALDGSASSDPEGKKLTYEWKQLEGPTVVLSRPKSARAEFTAPAVFIASRLVFQLTVSDGQSSATDLVNVLVRLEGNANPVANAGPDQAAVSGQTVTLDGDDSQADQVSWTQVSGPPVTIQPQSDNPRLATFVAPTVTAATPLVFRITAITGVGGRATDDVTVTVSPAATGSNPPTADAGPDQRVSSGTVRLDGSKSSDPANGSLTYHWEQLAGPQVRLSGADQAVATFDAPAVSTPTTLQFRLSVTGGAGAASDVVSIFILGVAAAPPLASASIDNFSIYPNPFSPAAGQATFEYDLGAECDVRLKIYDLFGSLVREIGLGRGGAGGAQGRNRAFWDGRNGHGETVGNGGYVVQIEATDGQGHTVRRTDRLAVVK